MQSVAKNPYLQRSFGNDACRRFREELRQVSCAISRRLSTKLKVEFCICQPESDAEDFQELTVLFECFHKERDEINTALQGGVFTRLTSTGRQERYDFTHSFVAAMRTTTGRKEILSACLVVQHRAVFEVIWFASRSDHSVMGLGSTLFECVMQFAHAHVNTKNSESKSSALVMVCATHKSLQWWLRRRGPVMAVVAFRDMRRVVKEIEVS